MPKNISRLGRIDQLIRARATGRPEQLAKTLGIAPSTLYNLIRAMRQAGAPIAYCRRRQSYCYTRPGRFVVGFVES